MAIPNILFVHQSAEMYGSDKVLLYLVGGVQSLGFHPIVLLPEDGPLLGALRGVGVETHIVPVTKLDRKTLSVLGLFSLPLSLLKSVRSISRLMKERRVDLVYSNTLAVLGSSVWARLHGIPHIWHVHEILMSPKVVRKGFPLVLRLLADKVICNSTMTKEWLLAEQSALAAKTVVIWNGQGQRPEVSADLANTFRRSVGVGQDELLVALVGRINRWKGQPLLVSTAGLLWERGVRNVHYVIVGGVAAGQEQLISDLESQIAVSPARDHIHVTPFTSDIWSVWDACDVAVVPSTEPEPFGMVAIEAMASRKPVVVAAHGGLLDIVKHGQSGLQFQPNDAERFADELQKLFTAPAMRMQLGFAGWQRQQAVFSLDGQLRATVELFRAMCSSKP